MAMTPEEFRLHRNEYMRRFRKRPDQVLKNRERKRKQRAKRTPEQRERNKVYQLRYYHEVKANTPEKRKVMAAKKMAYKARLKRDAEYLETLRSASICANPRCDRLALLDSKGLQTFLCPDHTRGSHNILNYGRPHGVVQHASI